MKDINKVIGTSEKQLLSSLIGKRFIKYRSDTIMFRPAVYQAVGAYFDGAVILIENTVQPIDYYGSVEDVGIISVRQVDEEAIVSRIINGEQIDTPIGQFVQDIQIINDTHYMSDGKETLYKLSYTKAIVFIMPDRQVVFEKDVWFSEDIFIYRGQHAADKIMSVDEEAEESDTYSFRVERKAESLAHSLHMC